jgi:hypothetical protein
MTKPHRRQTTHLGWDWIGARRFIRHCSLYQQAKKAEQPPDIRACSKVRLLERKKSNRWKSITLLEPMWHFQRSPSMPPGELYTAISTSAASLYAFARTATGCIQHQWGRGQSRPKKRGDSALSGCPARRSGQAEGQPLCGGIISRWKMSHLLAY